MKRAGIDYDKFRNCFEDIKHITSDLIWGDTGAVSDPFFSYIIPVYKRADLLRETLNTVLNQRPVDFAWDIVIVDNEAGGENDTERLIREVGDPRILYYRNRENAGPDGNYNRCIELARGKWLGMIHGDDLLVDDHLQRMGAYIRDKERGRKKLAYISPRYLDFKDAGSVKIKREDVNDPLSTYRKGLKIFRQTDAVITGYSVSLPSFGTVMNREVMLETGGFDKNLGICEDVITPYRLMKDYRVYVTPEIMGYHRFEGNESIKIETIFKICEAMCDFRDYMFERNALTRIWGSIARTPFFDLMAEYCSYLSGFSERRLKKADFSYVYPERKPLNGLKKIIFTLVEDIYCICKGEITYEKDMEAGIKGCIEQIKRNEHAAKGVIIYGAGRAGKCAERNLRKKYGIKTRFFAVTDPGGTEKKIDGIEVRGIKELQRYTDHIVVLATSVPEFYDEMSHQLMELGFNDYVAADKKFRTEE